MPAKALVVSGTPGSNDPPGLTAATPKVSATLDLRGEAAQLVERSPYRRRPTLRSMATLRRPGEVAQLVEHTAENRGVAGSIPALATSMNRGLPMPAEPASVTDVTESTQFEACLP